MEYRGLYIDYEEFGESICGCHCTVYTDESMEREVDDFYVTPSEFSKEPDVDVWIRKKVNEMYQHYAECGYVPKCVSAR